MSDIITGEDGLARTAWASDSTLLRVYYDTEWGMPVVDEAGVYERIVLEGFQSGLSWATILRKRPAFRAAFCDFDPDEVAAFDETDVERLMADPGIIRNRPKILAAIAGAKATIGLRADGGLVRLVWSFQPERTPSPRSLADLATTSEESIALAKALKRAGFSYVGPTTAYALMEAIGIIDTHLVGSHRRGCSGVFTRTGRARHRGRPPGGKTNVRSLGE